MFTPTQALEALTPEQRSELAADVELAGAFTASVQRYAASLKPAGVSFGGLTASADFDARRAFEAAKRELTLARGRAELVKADRKVMVVLEGPKGLVTMTDLNTLCDSKGLDWSERSDIRRAVLAGQTYHGDNAGWTRLTREFTVRGAKAAKRVFAGEAA